MIEERDLQPEPGSSPGAPTDDGGNDWLGAGVVAALLVVVGIWSWQLLLVILAILFFIFMHEMGHFATARLTGMKATEFFIGFGPRIFSFRRGETEFGLKPILAGAYVRIIGMNNLDDVDPDDEPRTYRAATYPRRVLVITAGSLMHFAMAIVLFFAYFAFIGPERIVNWDISEPSPDSAAEAAGLESGDRITSVDGVAIESFTDLSETVVVRAGEEVVIEFVRDDAALSSVTTIGERTVGGDVQGFLGVGPLEGAFDIERENLEFGAAVQRGFTELPTQMWNSLTGLFGFVENIGGYVDNVFTAPGNQDEIDLETRPVSVVGVADISSQIGWDAVFFLALFNVFIGVFNLLPLLPLDGGHLAVATYERLRTRNGVRHTVDVTRLLPVTYAVFAFMVVFGAGALWLDVANPIDIRGR